MGKYGNWLPADEIPSCSLRSRISTHHSRALNVPLLIGLPHEASSFQSWNPYGVSYSKSRWCLFYQSMLRTSFIAMYKKALGFGPGRPVGLLHEWMAKQSSFQSFVTPSATATALWIEKKKTFNGDEEQIFLREWKRRNNQNRIEWAKQREQTKKEKWRKLRHWPPNEIENLFLRIPFISSSLH